MFVSSHSFPERSGAATLTLALTAGLVVAMATLAPTMELHRAPSSPIHLFDISAADATATGRRQPEATPPLPPAPPMASAAVVQSTPVPVERSVLSAEPGAASSSTAPVVAGLISAPPVPADTVAAVAHGPASSVPSAAGTPARQDAAAADPYGRTVFREIRARQSYPEALARAGLEGTVVVELRISPRGRIVAASVLVSSQLRQLDEVALAQVRATPLPPPPRGEARIFRIPMTYRIG